MEDKVTLDQVEASIDGIVEKYNSEFYPFEVKQSGGGWQFLTKKDFHKTIAQLNGEKFLKRLSAAALETLAIIAYKQPVTKGEIETIRGVSTDYTIQKLLEKELIVISGRNEHLPGHPLIYTTSKSFMDYFGVNSAEDLPKIKEILANHIMEGTAINPVEFEQTSSLAVTDDGELIDGRNAETQETEDFHNEIHEGPEDIIPEKADQVTETYNTGADDTSSLEDENVDNDTENFSDNAKEDDDDNYSSDEDEAIPPNNLQ
jgi:segregation and condensation protein B